MKGQSRACTVLTSYMMRKYRWALLKALEFLNSRMPDFEIRAPFIHQLAAYENRLTMRKLEPKTTAWTEVYDKTTNDFENEELMLRNTYLNSQMGSIADFVLEDLPEKSTRLRWADELNSALTTVMEEVDDAKEETGEKSHFGKRKSAVVHIARAREENESRSVDAEAQPSSVNAPIEKSVQEAIDNEFDSKNGNKAKHGMTKSKSAKELNKNSLKNLLAERELELTFKPHVTQIINQTSINNFIISSPSVLELFEFSPKAQFIPKLNPTALMQFHKPETAIKQIVTVKRLPSTARCSSSITSREERLKTRGAKNKDNFSHVKVLSSIQESRSSLSKARVRLGSKVEPLKGESSDQLNPPDKIFKKDKAAVKRRPPTPGAIRNSNEVGTVKSVAVVSVKKTSRRNENAKQPVRAEPVIPRRFSSRKKTAAK
eukprot:TRINITY_DN12634_c0_g1_i3.p2 TRINITY_DN12634_c0_g1~~TRINITY_DN12634_c0_g1_i3.p2  ORF type:complete len:431 (-),score=53.84 TRINITY_DN12634_c0_g1_i3:1242-2534(-)